MAAGVTLRDRIRNQYIRGSLGVRDIADKMEEKQLRWYGHVKRRPSDHMVAQAMKLRLPQQQERTRGRPRHSWIRQQHQRLEKNNLTEADIPNRTVYHLRTRRADPNSYR
ncbi:hypothetical protein M8J77_008663 [Diaphorina citri]|nr:hypothetical protein M8J77_008663 [Diaphorina citri]